MIAGPHFWRSSKRMLTEAHTLSKQRIDDGSKMARCELIRRHARAPRVRPVSADSSGLHWNKSKCQDHAVALV
jgi:hypothetical protein